MTPPLPLLRADPQSYIVTVLVFYVVEECVRRDSDEKGKLRGGVCA